MAGRDADAVRLGDLNVGEQFIMLARLTAKTGSQFVLDLVGAGSGKTKRGSLTIDRTTAPFAVTGNFAQLAAGDQPADFKVEKLVFDVNVGDEVVTTDGVHYVVVAVGSDAAGSQLPDDTWSPSANLRPQFRFEDIAQNLGPA